jgi:hypothetical protein
MTSPLRRVLESLGAIVLGLAAAECALRIATSIPAVESFLIPELVARRDDDFDELFAFDPELAKPLMRPIESFRHVHDGGEYDYLINSVPCLGFYIRPPCRDGPGASFHFGDSISFGFGVAENETFVSLLDRDAPGRHANFSVPGDDIVGEIDQAEAMIRRLDPSEHPEALYFHISMGTDFKGAWKRMRRMAEPAPRWYEARLLQPVENFYKKSVLRRIVKNRRKLAEGRSMGRGAVPEGYVFVPNSFTSIQRTDNEWMDRVREVVEASTERIDRLRKHYAGRIVVTLIPPKEIVLLKDDVSPYTEKTDLLKAKLEGRGVVVVDPTDVLPPAEYLDLFFKIDGHFTPAGHEWFTDLLRARLGLETSSMAEVRNVR